MQSDEKASFQGVPISLMHVVEIVDQSNTAIDIHDIF
jgi:hypothetical protein